MINVYAFRMSVIGLSNATDAQNKKKAEDLKDKFFAEYNKLERRIQELAEFSVVFRELCDTDKNIFLNCTELIENASTENYLIGIHKDDENYFPFIITSRIKGNIFSISKDYNKGFIEDYPLFTINQDNGDELAKGIDNISKINDLLDNTFNAIDTCRKLVDVRTSMIVAELNDNRLLNILYKIRLSTNDDCLIYEGIWKVTENNEIEEGDLRMGVNYTELDCECAEKYLMENTDCSLHLSGEYYYGDIRCINGKLCYTICPQYSHTETIDLCNFNVWTEI